MSKEYKGSEDAGWGLFERRVIGRDGSPLFTRWTIFRTPWLAVRIHRFHRADPSCLHDHPWTFWSFILVGGYYEESPLHSAERAYGAIQLHRMRDRWAAKGRRKKAISELREEGLLTGPHVRTFYPPGSWLVRPAEWQHRVVPPPGVEPLTLVVTFKKERSWGFWTQALGWIPFWRFGSHLDDC